MNIQTLADGLSDQTVNDIPDNELLGRAVRNCKPTLHEPRWSIVSKRFGLGSTYSAQLCRRFGMDPHERKQRRRYRKDTPLGQQVRDYLENSDGK